MSDSPVFIDGLSAKEPHQNAPDFVKAKISIKVADLIAWLQEQQTDWVNADLKVSKQGNYYISVDDWKPETQNQPQASAQQSPQQNLPAGATDFDDDIPF